MNITSDFRKFAMDRTGMSGLAFDEVMRARNQYLNPYILEERQLNAGAIVREAAKLIKGGGGGAPHFATAGGKDATHLEEAVKKVIEIALG